MQLCSNDHDEVCYDGRDCPACKALLELNRALDDIAEGERRERVLDEQIDSLQTELSEKE